jgi:hypothetical protein
VVLGRTGGAAGCSTLQPPSSQTLTTPAATASTRDFRSRFISPSFENRRRPYACSGWFIHPNTRFSEPLRYDVLRASREVWSRPWDSKRGPSRGHRSTPRLCLTSIDTALDVLGVGDDRTSYTYSSEARQRSYSHSHYANAGNPLTPDPVRRPKIAGREQFTPERWPATAGTCCSSSATRARQSSRRRPA